ncbi:MAG: phenylalanine--tRNA ligase subunit beta [bacterium]|nr:phenylalanine--tRNA ligase subunit beta [bacterium]
MISMNWVKDYVNLDDVDLKDLANKITKAGVNVEKVIENKIDNLVIGKVLECINHPDSDHLHVCKVDTGSEILQIVCGAPNVRVGLKVIVSLVGAILPGNFVIKPSIIRGIESKGMLCALSELGLEEETPENRKKGIYEMPIDAPIGKDPLEYLELDDTLYELDLNPNRNIDCTNHIGFAYEVASVLGRKVTMPNISTNPILENVKDYLSVNINTSNCTMYNAKMVKDVVIKESPDFIKNRLIAAGMRPINNVVDISNYVMLEYGQPLHFFDKDKLGNKIEVRMANSDEFITTLDEKNRTLTNDDIVITNGKKPVCIAGVMGGKNSDIDENTKDIVIEGAIFNPLNVRYTSIRLDLRSEASLRYERGLNYEYTTLAIERACHLLEKYADGKVLSGTITIDKVEKRVKKAEVTKEDIKSILGIEMDNSDIEHSLNNLGFKYKLYNDIFTVEIPNRRLDVEAHKQDLVEEIGRLYGYDNIDSLLPDGPTKPGKYVGNVKYRKLISKRLRSLGLDEVKTYTLVSDEEANMFNYNKQDTISLLKPMSSDKKNIRQTLIPSLLKVIDYNKSRGLDDMSIYEISNVYYNKDEEETKISIALTGKFIYNNWNNVKINSDFYLLKGMVENLFNYLGFKNRYKFEKKEIDGIHPGISAEILLDKEPVGYLGKVHPLISRKNDIYVCEISLTKIVSKKIKPIKYKEISKFPSIEKDLAFIVDKDVLSSDIVTVIKKAGGKLLTEISVFDVYAGENLEINKKSIAYSLKFEDPTKTLTEEEVMRVFNKIIEEVETKLNAKVRDK